MMSPNWGQSTVVGHAGKLVYGTLSDVSFGFKGVSIFAKETSLKSLLSCTLSGALGCEGAAKSNAAGWYRLAQVL